jgi:hypothetical protein
MCSIHLNISIQIWLCLIFGRPVRGIHQDGYVHAGSQFSTLRPRPIHGVAHHTPRQKNVSSPSHIMGEDDTTLATIVN